MIGFGRGAGGGGGAAFPLSANLVGSWQLFGGDANQVDNSGNGNDLAPNNSPGQAAGGAPDGVNCAQLLASSGHRYAIDHASQTGLNPGSGDFAGCIWFNPSSLGSHQFIMGKYQHSLNGEWYLFYDSIAARFKFIARDTGGGGSIAQITTPPSIGNFYFLQFYIDATAQEIGLAQNDGTFDTEAFTTDVVSSSAPFTIGERAFTGNDHVNGRLAIAHVWNAIPSSAQWAELYNGGEGLRFAG